MIGVFVDQAGAVCSSSFCRHLWRAHSSQVLQTETGNAQMRHDGRKRSAGRCASRHSDRLLMRGGLAGGAVHGGPLDGSPRDVSAQAWQVAIQVYQSRGDAQTQSSHHCPFSARSPHESLMTGDSVLVGLSSRFSGRVLWGDTAPQTAPIPRHRRSRDCHCEAHQTTWQTVLKQGAGSRQLKKRAAMLVPMFV